MLDVIKAVVITVSVLVGFLVLMVYPIYLLYNLIGEWSILWIPALFAIIVKLALGVRSDLNEED